MNYDLIIIGGGAAGLFAAANVPSGKRVLLLEKTDAVGQKLRITGSGQCNLTKAGDIKSFLTRYGANGKYLRPVLFPFSNQALMSWFEARGLPLVTRADGKVFPASLDSRDVVKLLLHLAEQRGVEVRLRAAVTDFTPLEGGGFALRTPSERLLTRKVLVATGGASYPHTGSDGGFFDCLDALGLALVPRRPALAPIYVHGYPYGALSGIGFACCQVSLTSEEGAESAVSRGALLFTHRGFSGPVMLDHARNAVQGMGLCINYLPHTDFAALRKALLAAVSGESRQIVTLLETNPGLPRRFLEAVCVRAGLGAERKASQLSGQEVGRIAALLTGDTYTLSGTGGYQAAMVTAGGVALEGVDLRTMKSRLYPDLSFAGEVLDVDGDTGGYNLQFAFSSAKSAVDGMEW